MKLSETIEEDYKILTNLSQKVEWDNDEIKQLSGQLKEVDIINVLLRLASFGFVKKDTLDFDRPTDSTVWAITQAGKSYTNFLSRFKLDVNVPETIPVYKLVATIPPQHKEILDGGSGERPMLTRECLEVIVDSTQSDLRICSPFLDESALLILSRLKTNLDVRIISAVQYGMPDRELIRTIQKMKKLYSQLRAHNKKMEFRVYSNRLEEKNTYISHAKTYIADDKKLLVTSANLKESSILENFELGIYTEDRKLIDEAVYIFDEMWKRSKDLLNIAISDIL